MPLDTVLRRPTIRQALVDPNSFATTLLVALLDNYGTEMFSWSPETIHMEAQQDYSFEWPQANFDRLMAAIAIVVTDRFFKSLPDFVELCNILSGSPATPGVFDLADASDCAWGMTEALLLSPPDQDDPEPFTDEIRAYVAKMVNREGIITPPDILRMGLFDKDHRVKVQNDFSEDPELYASIWETEKGKTDDINDLMKERLTLLIQQLSNLKLTNGNTEGIAGRMLANLSGQREEGQPLA